MKVLFDSRLGLDGFTGISYVSRNVLESLIKAFGISNVYLYTNNKLPESEIPLCQQIITKDSPFSYTMFKLYPSDFDLIFCPHTSPQFTRKGQKLIFIIHDICFLYPFFWNKMSIVGFFKKEILKLKIKLVSKFSYEIITPSNVVKFYLKNKMSLSSYVIDNPISIPKLDIIDNFKQYNYVLYIGNLRNHKNIDLLVSIIKFKTNLNFVLIGINETDFKNKYGNFDNITFKSKLDYNIYLNYILHADLILNTSFCEGFCIPIYEALMLNKKVVCLNIPIFKHLGQFLYLSENSTFEFCNTIDIALFSPISKSFNFTYIPNRTYFNYFNNLKNELTN